MFVCPQAVLLCVAVAAVSAQYNSAPSHGYQGGSSYDKGHGGAATSFQSFRLEAGGGHGDGYNSKPSYGSAPAYNKPSYGSAPAYNKPSYSAGPSYNHGSSYGSHASPSYGSHASPSYSSHSSPSYSHGSPSYKPSY